MSICCKKSQKNTKVCGSASSSCWDISDWAKVVERPTGWPALPQHRHQERISKYQTVYLADWFAASPGIKFKAQVWKENTSCEFFRGWNQAKSQEFKLAKMCFWVKTKRKWSADMTVSALPPQWIKVSCSFFPPLFILYRRSTHFWKKFIVSFLYFPGLIAFM